jgi:hypothetical protein
MWLHGMSAPADASVLIEPEPATWRGLVASGPKPCSESQEFRSQMGLPSGTPLIVTGHQATVWHAGILAKYFAAEAVARGVGGEVGWLVVDQDAQDFGGVDIPVSDGAGLLRRQTIRLAPPPLQDAATASCPAFEPNPSPAAPGTGVAPSIGPGIEAITQALRSHREQPNAARQVAMAVADLVGALVPRRPMVYATDMARTSLMARLVHRMLESPLAMAEAYNAAVAAHPEARMAALRVDGQRAELPLWKLTATGPRMRVWSDEVDIVRLQALAPRALLMTGMMRLAGCELFIHGRGGGIYDTITEQWFSSWLGVTLAPTVVVSADLRLPLGFVDVSAKAVAEAKWRAHRAMHDPGVVGALDAATEKNGWLARIGDARSTGGDSDALYREMHRALERFRGRYAGPLRDLREAAARAERAHANAAIAGDRTWAFPLHERPAIESLRDRIFEAFDTGQVRADAPGALVSRPCG